MKKGKILKNLDCLTDILRLPAPLSQRKILPTLRGEEFCFGYDDEWLMMVAANLQGQPGSTFPEAY